MAGLKARVLVLGGPGCTRGEIGPRLGQGRGSL